MLGTSERALRSAPAVQERGTPELVSAIDRGRLAVSVAEKASRLSPDLQRRIAAEAEAGDTNAALAAAMCRDLDALPGLMEGIGQD